MNRDEINKEAASHWDYLVKTAELTNTPISLMSDRTYKARKSEYSMPKGLAEEHVSDVLCTFLEKSDERVAKIVSGTGNVKHYLTKCVMISVMSVRSSVNYKKKAELNTVLYDSLTDRFLEIQSNDEYDTTNNELMDIVEEALETLTEQERLLYNEVKVKGSRATQLTKKDMDYLVEYVSSYQTNLRIINHAHKKVLIYMQIPSVAKRIKTILNNE
jgi:hypothetical protein